MKQKMHDMTPVQKGAAAFVLLGAAATLYLAYLGAEADKPPSRYEVLVLSGIAIVAQIVASFMWSRVGRADPSHARSSVRRLMQVHSRSDQARVRVERAFDLDISAREAHAELGVASAELSFIAENALLAVEDWKEFHGPALRDLFEGQDEEEAPA